MTSFRGTTCAAIIIIITGMLLAGCASGGGAGGGYGSDSGPTSSATEEAPVGDIYGEWQLTKASDAEGAMTINGAPVTLVLAEGTVTGQAPCNTYTGDATVDGTDITIGTIAQTLMACADPARTELESRFLAALENVTTAKPGGVDPRTLTLSGPDETLNFTIIEKKAAN